MKILLLIGLMAYWVAIIRISVPKIKELIRLREDRKHFSDNFNAGHLDHIELLLSHRYSNLSFIFFVSLMFTLIIIALLVMGDSPA